MSTSFEKRIVIDLDNTLIDYGDVFHRAAMRLGLISAAVPAEKNSIRAHLFRTLPVTEAEHSWQKLQHIAYVDEIISARVDPKAIECISWLIQSGFEVIVLSHKSKKSHFDGKSDLRAPASAFLDLVGLRSLVGKKNILFVETLEEKIYRLCELNPCLVIDDLEKFLNDPSLGLFNKICFGERNGNSLFYTNSWRTIYAVLKSVVAFFPFTLKPLVVSSKNQLLLVNGSTGERLLKVFDWANSAEYEMRMAKTFSNVGCVQFPTFFGREDNVLSMEYINSVGSPDPARAYLKLLEFVQETRHLICDVRLPDDATTKEEYLQNISRRLFALGESCPYFSTLNRIFCEARDSSENDFSVAQKYCLLSDFSPANTIQTNYQTYFFDLEHSGMGNPARFLCNLILHPQNTIPFSVWEKIRKELNVEMSLAETVFKFSFIEWLLILAHKNSSQDIFKNRLEYLTIAKRDATHSIENFLRHKSIIERPINVPQGAYESVLPAAPFHSS